MTLDYLQAILKSAQAGATYLAATQTSALAAAIIFDSGLEVLPIGGFTGTIPSPTLSELQADIRERRIHLVLVATDHSREGARTGAAGVYLPGDP